MYIYHMTKTLLSISICVWITGQFSSAATVPAGTALVVRTMNAIHSDDRTGRSFKAKLDQNIMVQGRLVLAAGTILSGRVETSQAFRHSSHALTVNLNSITSGGQTIPIKTAGAFKPQQGLRTTRHGRSVSAGPFTVPGGTKMEFRLAEPLNV
jgi:hypothetical protein